MKRCTSCTFIFTSCVAGLRCPVDICNHGDCVQNHQGEFKCFCHHGYTGAFCRIKGNSEKVRYSLLTTNVESFVP